MSDIIGGFFVPGLPHPLLAADQSPAWTAVRAAFARARADLERLNPDLLVLYSTQWPSVIGHQIQADPAPTWTHVDQDWHDLGSIHYKLRIDAEYSHAWQAAATARGLHARTVNYRGFPVDTGTLVALELLDPERKFPASVVSCNMYADRAETLVLGKATRDALGGRRAVAIAVSLLSSRLFPHWIDPKEDRVSSQKDDEWNRKLLEILAEGRLEDAAQLARTFTAQANGDNKLKALWWLTATMGAHNRYDGTVYDYQPIWGAGAAVIGLTPSTRPARDQEFDEEDVEVFTGERGVLSGGPAAAHAAPAPSRAPAPATPARPASAVTRTDAAPKPVGPYPHARREGDLLFVSGMGPRDPATNEIPGGPIRDAEGRPRDYDVRAQTLATIANIRAVLEAAGSSLDKVVDVTAFLVDMDRDFAAFNEAYREGFGEIGPTRTTLAIRALPTPIAVELKVIARP